MAILFDIKVFLPNAKKFVNYGFAVLPLLDVLETDTDVTTVEYYLASGIFSLPVYQGSPSSSFIDDLREATEPLEFMQEKAKKGQIT